MLNKRIFIIVSIMGLMSGFCLMIHSNTLNFWLSINHIDLKKIGIFSLISLPYAVNFIWSPVLDNVKIPYLNKIWGQRISWIILIQTLLAVAVFIISKYNPLSNLFYIALYGSIISFLASTQDSILNAIRVELVLPDKQGEISGIYSFGYRVGMLMSNYGAIYASQYINWNDIYKIFSIIILSFPIILILCFRNLSLIQHVEKKKVIITKNKFSNFFLKIIKPIGNVKYILFILCFLILYRLPDEFISKMINPFLIHIGYNEFEISHAGKLLGITSSMIGGLLASYFMKGKDIKYCLFLFGFLHAFAHISFIVQEIYGKNIYLLFMVTGVESITGGMTMAAYIAFIASLCKGKYIATQYSFFSSMLGFSRSILPSISGYIVISFGWKIFYLFTAIATIPALIMILWIDKLKKD